jgi:hypothetical protein
MKNVLVFPCGSEIGLEVNRSLSHSTYFTLFGANSVDDHGRYVYKNYITVPSVNSPLFITELNIIIDQNHIDFVIPAHDSAVLYMAEKQDEIKATVITSCAETCHVCRSKKMTYELLEGLIPTPKLYTLTGKINFPVFLKPDTGQGGKGTFKANTKEEIEFYIKKDPKLLLLEYLPGKEYTVDCFTDKNGALLFAEGRERKRIKDGISVNSRPEVDARFQEMAEIINRTLLFRGVWFYQVKERLNGEFVLMEIAPRIAGTMSLYRADGVNFAQLSLFDRMGFDVRILRNNFNLEIDRALFSRFEIKHSYACVYIDFDDTIIVNNLINTTVMKFLYQSKNMGKKLVLLSKHTQDIKKSLKKYAISQLLFQEIIILKENEEKSDFIFEKDSIFIDDSFYERTKVFDKLNIPVFSVDMIESLLLWKV